MRRVSIVEREIKRFVQSQCADNGRINGMDDYRMNMLFVDNQVESSNNICNNYAND